MFGVPEHSVVRHELKRFDILIGVIHDRLKMGRDIPQRVVDPVGFPRDSPAELSRGVFRGLRRLRVDQIDDRLRLHEVHTPVEEGPLCKLSRLCLPRPGGKQGLQPLPQHGGGTVALQFRRILARVAVRGTADRTQAEVDHRALPIPELPVNQQTVRPLRHGCAGQRGKHTSDNFQRLRPAETEHADPRGGRSR